jgi:cyclic pyranopterin phosphate synthase
VTQALVDPHGRTVRDLRISITDRCNFRCRYCMPSEGMKWLPREELLSFEELERVARVCVERFGFARHTPGPTFLCSSSGWGRSVWSCP